MNKTYNTLTNMRDDTQNVFAVNENIAYQKAASSSVSVKDIDDDEDEEPARVLSDAEYAEMCKRREDIFHIENDPRLRNVEAVCIILAVIVGIFLSTRTVLALAAHPDFIEKFEERITTLSDRVIEHPDKKVEKKPDETPTDKKSLKNTKSQGTNSNVGGGDRRARVTQMGVLGIVSGQIKGKSVALADIGGKGGFASDIDAVLAGVGGLKSNGSGGVGRKGAMGIGDGFGNVSGFGGVGGGGIDDLIGNLMSGSSGNLNLKKRGSEFKPSTPDTKFGGTLTGGSSRASIQRVVMQNMSALRYAYNRRLREKPGLAGRITVKFAIDEFGKVIFAQLVESTMSDRELEDTVVARVRTWAFDKIDRPGDVTEVTYPFVFAQ